MRWQQHQPRSLQGLLPEAATEKHTVEHRTQHSATLYVAWLSLWQQLDQSVRSHTEAREAAMVCATEAQPEPQHQRATDTSVNSLGYAVRLFPPAQHAACEEGTRVSVRTKRHGHCFGTVLARATDCAADAAVNVQLDSSTVTAVQTSKLKQVRTFTQSEAAWH